MGEHEFHYLGQDNFGTPYQDLINYFSGTEKGAIVDLGAGPGRNSIFLARLGYKVTAVDSSSVDIGQILTAEPAVFGVVGDLYTYPVSQFDYILVDDAVRPGKAEAEKANMLVKRILTEMKQGAVFVNCIVKSEDAEKRLLELVRWFDLDLIADQGFFDLESEVECHLYAVRKRCERK